MQLQTVTVLQRLQADDLISDLKLSFLCSWISLESKPCMCETLQEIVDLMQEIKQKRTIVRCSERVSDCLLLAKDIAEASTTNTINFSRT